MGASKKIHLLLVFIYLYVQVCWYLLFSNLISYQEVIEELMQRVPLLKKIVDHYSGPDRVTAKKQQEELERVAKTLPTSAPSSVKEFTNRAVISLQVCNCKYCCVKLNYKNKMLLLRPLFLIMSVSAGVLLLAHAIHC